MYAIRKYIYLILALFVCNNLISQNIIQNDKFRDVVMFNGQVVFLKEISLKNKNTAQNFLDLKKWAQTNYGNDPIVSSLMIKGKDKKIYCASKIELLLPANKQNIRERVVMSYKLDIFILEDKCVMEIKDIYYSFQNPGSTSSVKTTFNAEQMISDTALTLDDNLKELRQNTRITTLFFLNQLAGNLKNNFK